MKRVLISTIHEGKTVEIVAYKLSPNKIVLVVDTPLTDIKRKAIERVKSAFKNTEVELVKTTEFDVPKATKDITKAIEQEKDSEITMHLSEGRKTLFLAGLFAASLKNIGAVYYLREDNNELYKLPLFDLSLSDTKLKILREIAKGNDKPVSITKKVGVHKTLVYANIKELISKGFISEDMKLTDAGRIAGM